MGEQTGGRRPPQEEEITVREAYSRMTAPESDAVLIDVREPWEYQPRRAEGAVSIPLSQFMQRFGEIPRDKEALIICEHGSRSLQAARFLARQGYSHAVSVDGGTEMWERAGLPMEHGTPGK